MKYPAKELPVLATTVRPGDTVPILVRRINTDKEARTFQVVTLFVCNSFPKPLIVTSKVQSVEAGDNEELRQSLVVPMTVPRDDGSEWPMPNGECYFRGRSEIQGLIRTMTVEWRTQSFHVEALS